MKKKILITSLIIFAIILLLAVCWELFVEMQTTYKGLEFAIPLFRKREVIRLSTDDFFDEERLEKIYLSNWETKRILKEIQSNSNWVKGEIDEKVEERLKFYTREDIYNKIPYIENKYWIFTNRSGSAKDKHSIDEAMNTLYYAISFGVFDVDNNILYYYQYDD